MENAACVSATYPLPSFKRLMKTQAHTHLLCVFISPIIFRVVAGLPHSEDSWTKENCQGLINESGEKMAPEKLSFQ